MQVSDQAWSVEKQQVRPVSETPMHNAAAPVICRALRATDLKWIARTGAEAIGACLSPDAKPAAESGRDYRSRSLPEDVNGVETLKHATEVANTTALE